MPSSRIHAREPRGERRDPPIATDPDVIASVLEDAAHVPGGHAAGVAAPANEAEVAALVRSASRVLPIGAQSSLTGGATPMGDLVLSTAKLNRILEIGADVVRVQPGVPVAELDRALARAGRFYPPAPTFPGAFIGGTVATNAAGAATFKYGGTRDWVRAITVVLADGSVLDVERGVTRAADGRFEIVTRGGMVVVPAPSYRLPNVPKVSAGYWSAPDLDLVDLFVGSEGTLGVITELTLRVVSDRPAIALAWVPFDRHDRALGFVGRLRAIAQDAWRTHDPHGVDVSGIEHLDARSLALLREDGVDRQQAIVITGRESLALLVTLELHGMDAAGAYEQIGRIRSADPGDGALVRFGRMLDEAGVLDRVEIAVPGDDARAAQLLALREGVPAAVNRRVGLAQRQIDPRIEKTAADMIVPFDAIGRLFTLYDAEFSSRGLDVAVWGHISDGNVHPNVIPRSYADVQAGKDAILAIGRAVIAMGGSPLAEHGVGRNPVKQQLLRELVGPRGIEEMRAVKRALDPEGKLAPGVVFS